MTKKVSLSGAMPGENNNGLEPYGQEFIDGYKPGQPLQIVNIVARVAISKITTKTETGEVIASIRLHHAEVVPAEHQQAFGTIIGDAFGARTGALELPFADGKIPLKEDEDPFPEENEPGSSVEDLEAHRSRGRA